MDIKKIITTSIVFISQKEQLHTSIIPFLKENNRQKILELIVENTVEDISIFGKLINLMDSDPSPPLSDKDREKFKLILFNILK